MAARLYSYWRSSASYRVRISLNLKGVEHEIVPVSLIKDGGQHRKDAYRARNPQMLVPFFDDGKVATGQSQAIIEYVDETYPGPKLVPGDAPGRARVRAFAGAICCDIQPLQNLRVLQYLDREFEISETARNDWVRHWIRAGFEAAEVLAAGDSRFAFGDSPTLADACLVPQMYNARRFELPLVDFPRLVAIDAACNELDAFRRAAPEEQPDRP